MNVNLIRLISSKSALKVNKYVLLIFFCTGVMSLFAVPDQSVGLANEIAQQSQSVTVSGTVSDQNGDPLIGASILEQGTNNGIISDNNGRFRLNVRSSQSVLVVSYVGFATREIPVGSNRQIDITLTEDARLVDEIVVIGYGTQRKGDVTSAISSVKSEDFTIGKIGDAAELVKGKIAGLSITKSSGDPNATSSIMLRGITTIKGSVSPLVLVDGVEGSLTTVAPDNIASIDVLKDASAAAIYGTRGANGVIIITTKTGKRMSTATATYSSYVSFSNWYKTSDFMDTKDIIYKRTNFPYEGYETDWLKAVTRKSGYKQNHSISLQGGTASSTYSANVTYSNEEGIMRKSDNRNILMQLDFSQYTMNDVLRFNFNLLHGRHGNSHNENSYVYRQALIHNPSSPIFNEDGTYYEEFSRFQYYNPYAIQNELIGDTRSNHTQMTGNITVEPIKGWKTNLMLSMKENNSTGQTYYTSKYHSQVTAKNRGWASKSSSNGKSENLELTSTLEKVFGKHRIVPLIGYSYLYNVYDGFNAGNGNFPSESYLYNNLYQGTILTDEEDDKLASMGSYKNDNKLIGFFGRVSYGYDNKYNLMLSVRREGSSKFGANHKWGTFPSASAGWILSNEDFMKQYTWLDHLGLRLGYGVTGVIPGGSYLSLTTFDYDVWGKHLSIDGKWSPSLKVAQNPNPNLKWEKTSELNFGIDWTVLGERLNGSIDIYSKKTVDLLYDYAVPVPPNMFGSTSANVGQMSNKGIEFLVHAIPVQTNDFEWNTTFTISHNSNKLLSLSNDLYETDNFMEVGGVSDPISVPTHAMEVGYRLGDFWGLKSVGVSKDGFVMVEVSDGNGGWILKEFDTNLNEMKNRQRLGNGLPQVYAGWNNVLRYKNFDMELQFTGQFGFKILNVQRAFYENNSIAYNRLKSAANWYGAIDNTGAPVIDPETGEQLQVQLAKSMSQGVWSDHIENGDFVKLTNATLGYNLPLSSAVRNYLQRARVYLSGQNLFCITQYSGLDPEVSNYFLAPGIDNRDKYPTVRSFTVGLMLTF
ncbi:MAG: SusC/RagA family TonB-linked outer membrane protein [Porphyromonadaceae bacterium]|nr:SusC/RagA family TonB-linked outer membrane protein [Porphyromonadaceae bacterium]